MKTIIFLIVVFFATLTASFKLRVVKVKISDEPHSGMDGSNLFKTGGRVKLKVCSTEMCCQTKDRLNTDDNNWEKGETNYFVGHQLQECENFELPSSNASQVNITWIHSGTNGVKIQTVWMRGSKRHGVPIWKCETGVKLEEEEKTFQCSFKQTGNPDEKRCNGKPEFCKIPFNKFLFPGSHNAGTGQGAGGYLPSLYQNQDLNLTEQLDFGMRLFDFDIIYGENGTSCQGLMTGHGDSSALYQCYDTMTNIFEKVRTWLNESENRNEVIVFYFGELRPDANRVIPKLKSELKSILDDQINKDWITNGSWPTLGQAVDQNRRIFVIIREENPVPDPEFDKEPQNYIGEMQVKDGKPVPVETRGAIRILTTFTSMNIGQRCSKVVKAAGTLCEKYANETDFVKLSVIGTFLWNWTPLEVMARTCNPRIETAFNKCQSGLNAASKYVNFMLIDFPNYPGPGGKTILHLTDFVNTQRAKSFS